MSLQRNAFWPVLVASLVIAGCGSDGASTSSADEHGLAEDAGHDQHAEGEDHTDALTLSAESRSAAGIVTTQAGPATLIESVPLYGVIAPNAEAVREVGARFPGVIRTVSTRIGDTVNRGDVLATVESNESLQTYDVVAPLTGVITARHANPGEQTGDHTLFTVANLSTVWVELSLFPRDLQRVHVGQAARILGSGSNLSATGKVVYVAPFGSSANQTLTARVLLENPDRKWAPGLYVTAEVTVGNIPVPVAIASEALQTFEGNNVVFVDDGKAFVPRPVQVGRSDGKWTEVLSGLTAGETYATRNSFIIKAELGKGEAEHEH